MKITRDALAEIHIETEEDRHDACVRCGRTTSVSWGCQCWTTGDLYVVDRDGLCRSDPSTFEVCHGWPYVE